MILKYQGTTRETQDESAISNLLRKGWVDATPPQKPEPPQFDPEIEKITFDSESNSYSVENLSQEEIDLAVKIKANSLFKEKINAGYVVLPENITICLLDHSRTLFTQMLSLVKEALDLGLITNDTIQTISDKDGQKHEITTLRFRQIMVQYGFYYKGLWDGV